MDHDCLSICTSPGAQQIQAYCHEHGAQVGVTLESVWWGAHKGKSNTPYQLALKVQGEPHRRWLYFSRDQITGYATGGSRVEIQEKIRAELANVL